MAKTDQPKGKYDPVASSTGSPSEVSFHGEEPPQPAPAKKASIRTNIIKCSGVLVILIVLALLTQGGQTDSEVKSDFFNPFESPPPEPFKFRVHCPVKYYQNYIDKISASFNPNDGELRRRLQESFYEQYKYGPWKFTEETIANDNFDPDRLYVVGISSVKDENGTSNLRYCSLMR